MRSANDILERKERAQDDTEGRDRVGWRDGGGG